MEEVIQVEGGFCLRPLTGTDAAAFQEAFSEEEQNMLSENTYTIYYTGGVGVDVCDKVSLLSVGESRTPYLSTNPPTILI